MPFTDSNVLSISTMFHYLENVIALKDSVLCHTSPPPTTHPSSTIADIFLLFTFHIKQRLCKAKMTMIWFSNYLGHMDMDLSVLPISHSIGYLATLLYLAAHFCTFKDSMKYHNRHQDGTFDQVANFSISFLFLWRME